MFHDEFKMVECPTFHSLADKNVQWKCKNISNSTTCLILQENLTNGQKSTFRNEPVSIQVSKCILKKMLKVASFSDRIILRIKTFNGPSNQSRIFSRLQRRR